MLVVALVIFLALFLVGYQVCITVRRKWRRRRHYLMAFERARKLGVPLYVIGDPDHGLASTVTGRDYGPGNVCFDLVGCSSANVHGAIQVRGRIEETLQRYFHRPGVVFESCTLEYVDDVHRSISDMVQLAGNDLDNVFTVRVDKWRLEAYLYPGQLIGDQNSRRIIGRAPPLHPQFDEIQEFN